jgi:hypothetical protein
LINRKFSNKIVTKLNNTNTLVQTDIESLKKNCRTGSFPKNTTDIEKI